MSTSIWVTSVVIAVLAGLVGVVIWLATRKGIAEQRAKSAEKMHEIDEAMADTMARPRDEHGTSDRLRRGDF